MVARSHQLIDPRTAGRLLAVAGLLLLAACVPPDVRRTETRPPVVVQPTPPAQPAPPVITRPIPEVPAPGPGTVDPGPPAPPPAPPVGAAGIALLNESRAHQAAGRYGQAAAAIERALRIEPRQPLLWIELGNIRLLEGNRAQAEIMARKALSLAAGDPVIEERAQRLIQEAQR